ncbi:MAG TPA: hypothetical protein VM029_15500 [Opitutaceae bacterium]|nr:hypothetical protein [Opitutaceae bacterium]
MPRALLVLLALAAVEPLGRAAEENFSRAVAPADFSAAGLGRLSPEELARLDVLVRDYKSGALAAARREAVAAEQARAAAESRAAKAEADARERAVAPATASAKTEAAKNQPGLLAKAKVMLTPGTEVEYSTVESRIVGDFRGWDGPTVFRLENGQRWQSEGTTAYVTGAVANPAVKITPGMLGTFWMTVEGVKPRVKVKLLGGGR